MEKSPKDKLIEFLNEKGKQIVQQLKDELTKKKKVASGKTRDSVSYTVSEENGRLVLRVFADEDIAYILGGRGKNKGLPPVEQIEKWIKERGLSTAKVKGKTIEKKRRSLAFAIGRSMNTKGVKRGLNLRSFRKKTDQQIFEQANVSATEVYSGAMTAAIIDELKKAGLPVEVK